MEEGRQQNAGYLNASAAAERLQRNVNREHFLCTDFLLAFWQVRTEPSHVTCPGHSCPTCAPYFILMSQQATSAPGSSKSHPSRESLGPS